MSRVQAHFLCAYGRKRGADDGALAHFSMPPSALGSEFAQCTLPANDAAHGADGPVARFLIFSREGCNARPAVDRDQPKSGGALTAARLVATMLT